jgi:MFS family permease
VAFAAFLMVKKFKYDLQEISFLFFLNNTIMFFVSPLIGKAIVRFGERRILSLEYFSLIFIFITYAYTESKYVAACFYIIDHMVFNFAIAIRTYFQRVADPRDIAPSMAVGFTINHIAAVVLPVAGGLLWTISYRIPFIGGAVMSAISLMAVQKIPGRIRG